MEIIKKRQPNRLSQPNQPSHVLAQPIVGSMAQMIDKKFTSFTKQLRKSQNLSRSRDNI